jgi:hypothetical protein
METQIIIKKGWEIVATYQMPLTMSKGDIVYFKGIEYKVEYCFLDVAETKMTILIGT